MKMSINSRFFKCNYFLPIDSCKNTNCEAYTNQCSKFCIYGQPFCRKHMREHNKIYGYCVEKRKIKIVIKQETNILDDLINIIEEYGHHDEIEPKFHIKIIHSMITKLINPDPGSLLSAKFNDPMLTKFRRGLAFKEIYSYIFECKLISHAISADIKLFTRVLADKLDELEQLEPCMVWIREYRNDLARQIKKYVN